MNARIPSQNNGQMGISPQMLQQGNQILQVLAQQGLTPNRLFDRCSKTATFHSRTSRDTVSRQIRQLV